MIVTNRNQKSELANRVLVDLSLKYFFAAILILFIVLVLSPEAQADEDTLSSTINIDSSWYVNQQEFEWNVIGENLSTLDIWYAYGSEAVDNTTWWSLYETIENLTGQNETGQFTFNFPNGTGYYLLESNIFNTLNNSELGNTSANFTGELIKFDNLKPDSTTTLDSGSQPTDSSISIPWSATDNFMLKSVQLEYGFSPDSGAVPGNWINYGIQNAEGLADSGQFDFHFLEGEGRYDFRLIARDHAGNEELAGIDTFVVLDGTPAQANYDYSGDYWVTGNTLIPWQISDNYELYSIEMRYCYKPDNSSEFGSWKSFQTISLNGIADEGSFNFNLPEGQGVYNFWLIANDEAGNSNPDSAIGAGGLNLGYDTESPSGVMSYDGSFWRNSEVTIQHSSEDNVDVAEVSLYYRFKEDDSSIYSGGYSLIKTYETSGGTVTNGVMKADALSGDGFYQFRIEVKDSAGNSWTSPNSNFNIGFDLEAPEIFLIGVTVESTNIIYNNERNILYYNSNTVTNEVIEIDGYCYETTSGIVEESTTFESSFAIFTDISEGSTWSTTFTFAFATSGNQTITITTLDNAGNSGSITISVVDDIEPPKTSIGLVIQGEVVDETENYTINPETKYSLSSYDAESGKKIIEYRFDEGDWLTYDDEPFTVPPKTSMIEYRATDYVGNQENFSSLGVELINMAPTTTIHSPSASKVNIEEGENIYFNGSGEDLDGEITKYRWISDIDGFISNSSSFNISNLSPGTHSIVFSVMDDQGSWSAVSVVTVNVSSSYYQNITYLLVVLALAGALVCYNIYFNKGDTIEDHSGVESKDADSQKEILDAEEALNCACCGTGVKLDAKFCKTCGSNLDENAEPAIECVGCGEMVPIHKSFCKNCGEKID